MGQSCVERRPNARLQGQLWTQHSLQSEQTVQEGELLIPQAEIPNGSNVSGNSLTKGSIAHSSMQLLTDAAPFLFQKRSVIGSRRSSHCAVSFGNVLKREILRRNRTRLSADSRQPTEPHPRSVSITPPEMIVTVDA